LTGVLVVGTLFLRARLRRADCVCARAGARPAKRRVCPPARS